VGSYADTKISFKYDNDNSLPKDFCTWLKVTYQYFSPFKQKKMGKQDFEV